jgi:hypothetical protein
MSNVNHHGRIIITFLLSLAMLAAVVYWGWNSAVPDIFGLPPITIGQLPGLLALLAAPAWLLRPGSRQFVGKSSRACRRDSPGGKHE